MTTTTRPAMATDVLRRPRPWRLALAITAAVLVAVGLLFGLLLAALSFAGNSGHGRVDSPSAAAVPSDTTQMAPIHPVEPNPASDLTLPQPTGYEAGVPVGFPRTAAGAVAAAYGYSRIATGLDVQATLKALEAVAGPQSTWFRRSRAEIADGLVAQRKSLGLPAVGPTGTALINVSPSGYRIDRAPDDVLTVRTLNVVSTQSTDGTASTGTIVFRWALRWNGEQWLATATFLDPADEPLAVAPFTSAAEAKGWKAARGG